MSTRYRHYSNSAKKTTIHDTQGHIGHLSSQSRKRTMLKL